MLHVYLGRFAPFHEGHKILLAKLVQMFGIEKCLVLIGSANVLNRRTPYTFDQRKDMVLKYFPRVKIVPLNDVRNDDDWLQSIKDLEVQTGEKFTFYGGSSKDLEILSRRFQTYVLVDRFTEGRSISATQIRKNLRKQGILD